MGLGFGYNAQPNTQTQNPFFSGYKRLSSTPSCKKSNYRESELLSLPEPNTGNGVVTGSRRAIDSHVGERVLAQLLQPLEHAPDQVVGHEDLTQLLRVLVLAVPDRVELLVFLEVLPEVGQRDFGRVLVGVGPLELVHVEGALGHLGERVLCNN